MLSVRAAHRTFARLVTTGIVAAAATATAMTVAPTTALASTTSMESQFISLMNSARSSNGLRPYAVASDLTSVARQHSRDMASRNELYHNPNLTTQVQDWQAVGENVGEGPTVSDIHTAFMNSPEHRSNILDHDFTQVGVGVSVDGNGTVWVTEDFRQPMHSTSTSTSTPTAPRHHTTSTTSQPHVTATRPASTGSRSVTTSAPHVVTQRPTAHVNHPTPAPSPRARLLARLTAIQSATTAATSDPVAGAFDYLTAVTTLTSAT